MVNSLPPKRRHLAAAPVKVPSCPLIETSTVPRGSTQVEVGACVGGEWSIHRER